MVLNFVTTLHGIAVWTMTGKELPPPSLDDVRWPNIDVHWQYHRFDYHEWISPQQHLSTGQGKNSKYGLKEIGPDGIVPEDKQLEENCEL